MYFLKQMIDINHLEYDVIGKDFNNVEKKVRRKNPVSKTDFLVDQRTIETCKRTKRVCHASDINQ